jgi:hypothetical protein
LQTIIEDVLLAGAVSGISSPMIWEANKVKDEGRISLPGSLALEVCPSLNNLLKAAFEYVS